MSDGIAVTAGSGTTVATDDISSVHYPRNKLIFGGDGVNSGDASLTNPYPTRPFTQVNVVAGTTITRPSDTTAYAANDAVANNTTAGSVTVISWTLADANDAPLRLARCRIQTTCTGINNAAFRLWLFNVSPTPDQGDNAAWNQSLESYIGSMWGTFRFLATEGAAILVPDEGVELIAKPSSGGQIIYGLMQTLTAFTPSSAATFISYMEFEQARAA